MKKLFNFLFLFIFITALAQNNKYEFTNDYDTIYLSKLSMQFNMDFISQKKKVIDYAINHNVPLLIRKGNSLMELMRIVDDGTPIYFTTYNFNASISSRANTLHTNGVLGLNLNGESMVAYVWDGGVALSTHQEFQNSVTNSPRYSLIDSGAIGLSDHATHVTGTIMATGIVQNAIGMAPKCNVKGADWNNDLSEVTNQVSNGMLLSNHSYGNFNTTIPNWWFGAYIDESRNWDLVMYNAPYYLMVCAAGNDGEDNSSNSDPLDGQTQYDKLNGKATSKNNLVIANANDASVDSSGNLISVTINTSSSQGPTDDYRIKPDLTGNGTQLYSSISTSTSSYDSFTGTSMATPNVTGTLLLLQQYYQNINGLFMKSATLKGLALHTADDSGIPGPDAKFGWGLINAKEAAVLIGKTQTQNSLIDELSLNNTDTYSLSVLSDGINALKVSISWTDPPGIVNSGTANDNTPVLVNDLDLRVTKDGTVFLPYKLDGVLSNTKGDNVVDPFERIDIDNPTGMYTITINHKGTLTDNHQDFSLIVSGIQYDGVCEAIPPNNFVAGDVLFGSVTLSWDFLSGVESYEVRYKVHDSSDWMTISTNQNNISLSNIIGNTLYDAQIRSICSDGQVSEYSSILYFPNYLGVKDFSSSNFVKINLNNDYLKINTLNDLVIEKVNLYDLLGKLIISKNNISKSSLAINLSNLLSENIYIIKVELSDHSVIVRKIFY